MENLRRSYFFSGENVYDRNDFIPISSPVNFYNWCFPKIFLVNESKISIDALKKELGDDVYIFHSNKGGIENTVERGTPAIFLKKRSKSRNNVKYTGSGLIVVCDESQQVFKEAEFDTENYRLKKNSRTFDANGLTVIGEPFFIYRVSPSKDLVEFVEKKKKPNELLAVGQITKGARCASVGDYRRIIPAVRLQTVDFDRSHEIFGK